MSKQKRYGTEHAINGSIDAVKSRIQELSFEAEALDLEGRKLCQCSNTVEAGKMKIIQASKIREASIPRQEAKLEKLKQALSEFRTETFTFLGNDPSSPACVICRQVLPASAWTTVRVARCLRP